MKLSDKHCYPFVGKSLQNPNCEEEIFFEGNGGLTFRERLIVAGFGNPKVYNPDIPMEEIESLYKEHDGDVRKMWEAVKSRNKHIKFMLEQVDSLIKELENEK